MNRAGIYLYMGPMGSGKTEMLLRKMRLYRVRKCKCVLIKHCKDDKRAGAGKVVSKAGYVETGTSANTLAECADLVKDCDVVGVDEGQFFKDLVEMCDQWADEGKVVVVAALDGDFCRNTFGAIPILIPRCEKVKKLNAICLGCGAKAAFTRRLVDAGDKQELVGGLKEYSPVCRDCYRRDIGELSELRLSKSDGSGSPYSPGRDA